jgi:8-oxo-dGTP diphosphatase
MLREALKALRRMIHFEPIGVELLPENFTKTQQQSLYEAILRKSGMDDSGDELLKLGI